MKQQSLGQITGIFLLVSLSALLKGCGSSSGSGSNNNNADQALSDVTVPECSESRLVFSGAITGVSLESQYHSYGFMNMGKALELYFASLADNVSNATISFKVDSFMSEGDVKSAMAVLTLGDGTKFYNCASQNNPSTIYYKQEPKTGGNTQAIFHSALRNLYNNENCTGSVVAEKIGVCVNYKSI